MREDPGVGVWIRLALRSWRLLAGVALGAGILSLAVGFVLPRWYVARASVLPPHEAPSPLMAAQGLAASLQLESLLPFAGGVTLTDVYLGILNSDTVARTLADRYDLQARYEQSTMVRTLKALRKRTWIAPTENWVIEIKVEDKDPAFAAELANAYLDELDRVFRATRTTAGRRQREFLEGRLATSRAGLDSLELALAEMQAGRQMSALGKDLTEAAMAAGELLGRRLALAVRLEMLMHMGMTDSPAHRQTEAELRSVEMEAEKLPRLGVDVARQLRDYRMREVLHEAMARELEAARIEEVRDTPVVEVLDRAVPPDRHRRPRKGLMAMAGALAGFALAFAWVVYNEPMG